MCPGPPFEFAQGTFSRTQSLAFVTDSRNSKEKYRTLERDSSRINFIEVIDYATVTGGIQLS